MAILIFNAIRGTNEDWATALKNALPEEEIRVFPDVGDPAEIDVMLFGRPALKELPPLPNLKLMMTLLAGVETVIANPALPDAPLAKVEPEGGDPQMTEYALLHVLRHHRQMHAYHVQQMRREWNPLPQPPVAERTVGFLGYGTLTKPMVELIKSIGFEVIAWARTAKPDADIDVFHGDDGLKQFLAKTEIAVCMLPVTPETTGLMNKELFAALPKGASIINLARGIIVVNDDLIAALDSGHLSGATLDVTEPEPLPEDNPLWVHPLATIMPHVARRPPLSQTIPVVVENIRRLRAGESLINLVDRKTGY